MALTPPSAEVQALLELIPDQAGFLFTGQPDQPHLHPLNNYRWTADNPSVITSVHNGMVYPNDQYPENRVLRAINRKGQVVEYPYYADANGKRYFLTAHSWYQRKNHVLSKLVGVANTDPLGAARLLHRFAQVYEGWVPTNEYPWFNRPVEPSSTPPNYYWGGMWSRWFDMSGFRTVAESFGIVTRTAAFAQLSQEVGEDVRTKLVDGLFTPTVDFYRSLPIAYTNMDYHVARSLIAIGKALDDPSYIHETVEWAEEFARRTYLFDGFFEEVTLSYHAQSTSGLNIVIDEADGWTDPEGYVSPRSGTRLVDLDLGERVPVLDKAVDIPNMLIYPDGKYFPVHETWAYSKAGSPQWDAGSFFLPAAGIARLARGRTATGDGTFGIVHDFLRLEITEQSVEHQAFSASNTLQLEANEPGHHIAFAFDVEQAGNYEVDLRSFRAGSYGRYTVTLDDAEIATFEFYGVSPSGPQEFEAIEVMDLASGAHEITFTNVGKHDSATNYKLGLIQLALLDEEARRQRDEAVEEGVNPSQAYLTFATKYGHSHHDALNLSLYGNGQELLPDLGYTHTFYRHWTLSTLGHNTVVVDSADALTSGAAQHGGNLEVFAAIDGDVQVMRAEQRTAYTQTSEYRREPWFIEFPDVDNNEGYVLDLFRVSGGDRHEYTLHGDANVDGAFQTAVPLADYGPYLLPDGVEVRHPETEVDPGSAEGHYYGYIYVRDVKRGDIADGRYDLTLVTSDAGQEKSRLRVLGAVEAGANELFLGESPSMRGTRLHGASKDTNNEAVKYVMPTLVLRREGTDLTSSFVTVLEPHTGAAGSRVQGVERLTPDSGVAGDVAVRITHSGGVDLVLSSLNSDELLTVGDVALRGKMGLVRYDTAGVVQGMHLVGGASLKAGAVELTAPGPVVGKVTGVRRRTGGDAIDAFIVDTSVPTDVAGTTIVVTHPDGKAHGYRIRGVVSDSAGTAVELDDMEPGFAIKGDGTSELLYQPFTQWTGETTFRIENVARR